MSLKMSLFIAIITQTILLCSSLYLPLLSPPKSGDGGTGMTLNILQQYPDLECEPENPDFPPLAGLELGKNRKKVPKCPPGSSRPMIAKLNPNITVKAGDTITIEIAYGGFPEPTIEYYRGDTQQRIYETALIKPFKRYEKLNASRVTDRGLYLIKAVNSEGTDSVKIYVDVLDRPSIPNGPLNATEITQNTVTLSWLEPDDSGGSRISRYVVDKYTPENATWEFVLNTTKTSKVVGYLTPGQKYKFRVSAANKYGVSDPLETVALVLAIGRPSVPRNVAVIKDNGAYEVSWQPPKRDNGGDIKTYIVESRELPNGNWSAYDPIPSNQSKYKVTGNVQSGKNYEFRVSAVNNAGVSDPSKATSATEVPLQIAAYIDKSGLKNVTAKVGDSISFEAAVAGEPEPEFQWKHNDQPINEQLENINITAEGNRTILHIQSVNPNHIGTYSLRVNNTIGSDSATVSLTLQSSPLPTPGGPIEVVNTTGDCLRVKWSPSIDLLASPFSYRVEMFNNDTNNYTPVAITTEPEANICGLKPNSDIKLRIKAVNPSGESEPLDGVVKTPSDKLLSPGPPIGPLELIAATPNSLQLRWSPSIDSPVDYIVEIYKPDGNNYEPISISSNTEIIANGLIPEKQYRFRIKAINLNGESEPIIADFYTPGMLDSPINPPPSDFGNVIPSATNIDNTPISNIQMFSIDNIPIQNTPLTQTNKPISNNQPPVISLVNANTDRSITTTQTSVILQSLDDNMRNTKPLKMPNIINVRLLPNNNVQQNNAIIATPNLNTTNSPNTNVQMSSIDSMQIPNTQNTPLSQINNPISNNQPHIPNTQNTPLSQINNPISNKQPPIPNTQNTPLSQINNPISNNQPTIPNTQNTPLSQINNPISNSEPPIPNTQNTPLSQINNPISNNQPPIPNAQNTPLSQIKNPISNNQPPIPNTQNTPLSQINNPISNNQPPIPNTQNTPLSQINNPISNNQPPIPNTQNTPLFQINNPISNNQPSVIRLVNTNTGQIITTTQTSVNIQSIDNIPVIPKTLKTPSIINVKLLPNGNMQQINANIAAPNFNNTNSTNINANNMQMSSINSIPLLSAQSNSSPQITKLSSNEPPIISLLNTDSGPIKTTTQTSFSIQSVDNILITTKRPSNININLLPNGNIQPINANIASPPLGPIELVKATNDSLQLKWNEPIDKTQPIVYKVEKLNPATNSWEPIGSTPITQLIISGLSPNTEYKFRIKSSTSVGDSAPIESSTLKTNGNRPDPPIGPLVVTSADNCQVILSWNPPANNSGNAAKEYKVEVQKENSDKWELIGKSPATKNRLSNLEKGQTYKIRVKALNDFGESEPLETVYKLPTSETKTIPSPPEGPISASNINADGVTLTWKAPKNDGGEPVLVYKVEKLADSKVWEPIGETTSTKVMISGLKPGSRQKFRVLAVNKLGSSVPLETDGEIVLKSVPTSPGKPEVSVINPNTPNTEVSVIKPNTPNTEVSVINSNTVILKWKAPDSDNGAKIISYIIEYVETGTLNLRIKRQITTESSPTIKTINTQNADTFAKIETLEPEKSYKFRIRAVNEAGIGPASEWSDVITTPAKGIAPSLKCLATVYTVKEGEPLNLEIPYSGQPLPQFVARKLDGGLPLLTDIYAGVIRISSPKVVALNGGKYLLMAMNNIGKDQKIIEIIVTKKSTVPSIPTGPLMVTDITTNSAIIRWQTPISDGGERVIKYLVEKFDPITNIWDKIGETQTPGVKLNLLKPHQKYKFRVTAINIIGASLPLESDIIETLDNEIPPKIDRKNLKDIKVKAGESVNIFVESSGQPSPKLTWIKLNDMQICDGNYQTTNGVLSIKSAQRWHSGLYQITSQNNAGTDTVVIKIDIVDTPSQPLGPLTVTQLSDGKVLLQWQPSVDNGSLTVEYLVEKFDLSSYQWIPVGKTRSTQHIVTDPNINPYSRFRVSAINEAGKSYPIENSGPIILSQSTQRPLTSTSSSLQSTTTEKEREIFIQVEDDEIDDLRDLSIVNKLHKPEE